MTYDFAKKLLDPNTHHETMVEVKYYAGFNKDEPYKTLKEACILACKSLDKQQEVNEIAQELNEIVCNLNLNEIAAQIQSDNLSSWLRIITKRMYELIQKLEVE